MALLADLPPQGESGAHKLKPGGRSNPHQLQAGHGELNAEDVVSFNAAISCCEQGCQWPLALHLLRTAQLLQLSPDVVSCLARAFGVDQNLSLAKDLVLRTPKELQNATEILPRKSNDAKRELAPSRAVKS